MKKRVRRNRNKVNLIISGLLVLMGVFMLVVPFLSFIKPNNLLYITFSIYALLKILEVFLTPETTDHEDIYTAIACALAAISGFKFASLASPMVLSITLVSWVGIMSIIKLIKLDYLDDRKNDLFYVNLITFALFLTLGLLTCVNLYFSETVSVLMLGFFFVINGILNLAEDGIRILVTTKPLKIKDVE